MAQALLQTTRAHGIPPTALRKAGHVSAPERLITGGLAGVLALLGWRRGGPVGFLGVAAGAALAARAISGYCPLYAAAGVNPLEKAVASRLGWKSAAAVSRSVTINKPREEVYAFWRNFSNLPRFMGDVQEVRETGNGHVKWVWRGTNGPMEADATLIEDEHGRQISWKSAEDAPFRTSGTVQFRDAPGQRGTEVTLMTAYEPQAGQIGRAASLMWHRSPLRQAHVDLRRLKQILETGETATGAMRRQDRTGTHVPA